MNSSTSYILKVRLEQVSWDLDRGWLESHRPWFMQTNNDKNVGRSTMYTVQFTLCMSAVFLQMTSTPTFPLNA